MKKGEISWRVMMLVFVLIFLFVVAAWYGSLGQQISSFAQKFGQWL